MTHEQIQEWTQKKDQAAFGVFMSDADIAELLAVAYALHCAECDVTERQPILWRDFADEDNSIDWNYSTGGHFESVSGQQDKEKLSVKMIEFLQEQVPAALCTIDRFGGADDFIGCGHCFDGMVFCSLWFDPLFL